jgi:hypothetical protein
MPGPVLCAFISKRNRFLIIAAKNPGQAGYLTLSFSATACDGTTASAQSLERLDIQKIGN